MVEFRELASGLSFPEGPIAMADGSVVLVEMFGQRITRVAADGTTSTVAEVPGGPNGAAIGPDGALYVCNNGGCFTPVQAGDVTLPGPFDPARYLGGRIQRIDLVSATVTDLYTECDGRPLRAPNDLVFDAEGGFWFTDHGIRDHHSRTSDLTGIYYARADGSSIREAVYPTEAPNGIGLSPAGDVVYWAETFTGRVHRRRIVGPGEVEPATIANPWALLCGLPGMQLLDSLAIDGDGNVCVATLVAGMITVIAPDGQIVEQIPTGESMPTNICFGGDDRRSAFVTCSGTGRLLVGDWPRPGLRLAYEN